MIETNLNGKTPDLAEENIQKLRSLFPDTFTEGKVDFEKLQQLLGNYIETSNERYNFSWNGKAMALRLAQTPSMGTLRPCREESKDWDTTKNLYIEGDNLEVLKLLQKSYHSKVKMIYIDPPYNTGGDFVYPDNFADSIENYKVVTGQIDSDGKSISSNSETSGRYHTDWLNMTYPRLRLARNLLSDDGVIFISIDDNEIENLKKLCNEIFGEENFVASTIRTGNSSKNKAKYVSVSHDYALIYAKSLSNLKEWSIKKNNVDEFVKRTKQVLSRSENQEEIKKELRELVKYPRFYDFDHYTNCDRIGPFRANDLTAIGSKNFFEIIHPITRKSCKKSVRGWAYNEDGIKELLLKDQILFGQDENTVPQLKCYLMNSLKQIPRSVNFYDSQIDSKWLRKIGIPFDFSKPVDYIKDMVEMINCDDCIILDFFSGSATTAHAVMQLNAEDNGNRRFIMVQLQEPCSSDSEAFKAGYKNICEIGKERIRRAGEKIKDEKGSEAKNLDIGFKVLKLDSSNIRKWQPDYENLELSLTDYIDNYVAGRTEFDVAYEIMLKFGLDLTYPIDEVVVANKKVYSIGFGMLIICLDNEITTEVADGILELVKKLAPETTRVVFKDNGFKTDSNKTNIKEILKCGGIEEFITL